MADDYYALSENATEDDLTDNENVINCNMNKLRPYLKMYENFEI